MGLSLSASLNADGMTLMLMTDLASPQQPVYTQIGEPFLHLKGLQIYKVYILTGLERSNYGMVYKCCLAQ